MWGLHGLPVEYLFSLCPNPLVLTVALRAPVSLKFLWVLTLNTHIWGSSGPEILALPPEGRLENHQLEIADGQRRALGQGPGTRIQDPGSGTYSLRVSLNPVPLTVCLPIC